MAEGQVADGLAPRELLEMTQSDGLAELDFADADLSQMHISRILASMQLHALRESCPKLNGLVGASSICRALRANARYVAAKKRRLPTCPV